MPSTPTDVHLSEVHLHIAGSTSGAEEVSSFAYSTADSQRGEEEQDEDGDQVVKRRRMVGRSGVLKLKHALATPLPDVGLQVWRGALLLCDYLLARPALVRMASWTNGADLVCRGLELAEARLQVGRAPLVRRTSRRRAGELAKARL